MARLDCPVQVTLAFLCDPVSCSALTPLGSCGWELLMEHRSIEGCAIIARARGTVSRAIIGEQIGHAGLTVWGVDRPATCRSS